MSLLVWFGLPARDLDRAIAFYSAVLASPVQRMDYPGTSIGLFNHEANEAGGCIYVPEETKPTDDGALLYFGVAVRLEEAEALVEPNGGQVLETKHAIGPHGFRTIIRDSEDNRVALHSV